MHEVKENELTTLQAGDFDNYEAAVNQKDELIKLGIPGPFVVAYDSRQKISVKAAQKYIDRSKYEEAEKPDQETRKKDKKSGIKDSNDKNW